MSSLAKLSPTLFPAKSRAFDPEEISRNLETERYMNLPEHPDQHLWLEPNPPES